MLEISEPQFEAVTRGALPALIAQQNVAFYAASAAAQRFGSLEANVAAAIEAAATHGLSGRVALADFCRLWFLHGPGFDARDDAAFAAIRADPAPEAAFARFYVATVPRAED